VHHRYVTSWTLPNCAYLCSPPPQLHLPTLPRTRSPRIEALLAAGTLVLCDRYAFSGVAFTAAKPGAPTVAWCAAPDEGLPAPDATLFLDVPPAVARTRGGYGEERYEKEEHQARVREAFAQMRGRVKRWSVIDAGQTMDEVERAIWQVVVPLATGVHGPLERLWEGSFSESS
jgi:dTMP kinase